MAAATPTQPKPINDNIPANYQIRLSSSRNPGFAIASNIPEQFSLSVSSSWDQPFNKSFTDYLPDAAKAAAAGVGAAFGQTTMSKIQTVSVWQQGAPMSISLPMVFRAHDSAVSDVVDKIVTLMSMVCPYTQGGMLHAPGPTLSSLMGSAGGNAASGGDSGEIITLEIGNFIRMTPVIVENVNVDFDTKFDKNGNPMSAVANVTIITPYIVTRSDLAGFFVSSNSIYKDIGDSFSWGGIFDLAGSLLGIKDQPGSYLPLK